MAIPAPRPGAAALITGASSGLGTEFARQLCARGHDLIVVARRRERLDALADELRARDGRRVEVVCADVADPAGRAQLLADIDRLGLEVDVFVPSAGFGMGGPFLEAPPERLEQLIRTNVEAVVAMSRALAPPMAARGSGAILIVSSLAGAAPMPNFGTYAATKAAMTSFAETLHWELGRSGDRPRGVRSRGDRSARARRPHRDAEARGARVRVVRKARAAPRLAPARGPNDAVTVTTRSRRRRTRRSPP
jgi:hypothetical protein